jgi:hypothetical protein
VASTHFASVRGAFGSGSIDSAAESMPSIDLRSRLCPRFWYRKTRLCSQTTLSGRSATGRPAFTYPLRPPKTAHPNRTDWPKARLPATGLFQHGQALLIFSVNSARILTNCGIELRFLVAHQHRHLHPLCPTKTTGRGWPVT